jgi:cytochrome o ubiquinol oxidase subunit 1
MPLAVGIIAFTLGFGFVWHMYWMSIASLIGIIILLVVRSTAAEHEYTLPAGDVAKIEKAQKERYA